MQFVHVDGFHQAQAEAEKETFLEGEERENFKGRRKGERENFREGREKGRISKGGEKEKGRILEGEESEKGRISKGGEREKGRIPKGGERRILEGVKGTRYCSSMLYHNGK